MKAKLTKTSDWEFKKKVDVETIDDVLKYHNKVVLKKADEFTKSDEEFKDCEIEIEIYDDWRE
jgi:predicted acetyltransferase